jgi:hypothetical protein
LALLFEIVFNRVRCATNALVLMSMARNMILPSGEQPAML